MFCKSYRDSVDLTLRCYLEVYASGLAPTIASARYSLLHICYTHGHCAPIMHNLIFIGEVLNDFTAYEQQCHFADKIGSKFRGTSPN